MTLLCMSHAKLGHFLLITPQLQELEKKFSDTAIVVPEKLVELYTEQKIFNRFLTQPQATDFMQKQKCITVLDLTYPLLKEINIPDFHARLPTKSFLKPQHITKSYSEALSFIFQIDITSKASEKRPFIDIEIDVFVLQRYQIERFQYFTVHTGPVKSEKCWASENFESSILQILEKNSHLKCVNIIGPGDTPPFCEPTDAKWFDNDASPHSRGRAYFVGISVPSRQ